MELTETDGRPVVVITDDDIAAFEDKNWSRVPAESRDACVQALRAWIGVDDETVDHLRGAMGSPGFHMFGGMAVRNRLRDVLRDDELPPVRYPDGNLYSNWDDFYMAALREAYPC